MSGAKAWGALFLLAIVLIVAGFQGSFGKLVAVVFVPDELDVVNDFSNPKTGVSGASGNF